MTPNSASPSPLMEMISRGFAINLEWMNCPTCSSRTVRLVDIDGARLAHPNTCYVPSHLEFFDTFCVRQFNRDAAVADEHRRNHEEDQQQKGDVRHGSSRDHACDLGFAVELHCSGSAIEMRVAPASLSSSRTSTNIRYVAPRSALREMINLSFAASRL